MRPVFIVGSGLHVFYFLSYWVVSPQAFADRLGFLFVKLAHNGLRVGDVALCCACGKAILLTRCQAIVAYFVFVCHGLFMLLSLVLKVQWKRFLFDFSLSVRWLMAYLFVCVSTQLFCPCRTEEANVLNEFRHKKYDKNHLGRISISFPYPSSFSPIK